MSDIQNTPFINIIVIFQSIICQGVPNDMWRLTKMNDNYEICDSYPAIWAIPVTATEEDLRAVAAFRLIKFYLIKL